jgi:hexosaminidase
LDGGNYLNHETSSKEEAILETAIVRVKQTILMKQFFPWKFHPRNSDFEPATNTTKTYIKSVSIQQNSSSGFWTSSSTLEGLDESYNLLILEDGKVSITTNSLVEFCVPLKHFLNYSTSTQTWLQVSTQLAPIEISDWPCFQHRGLNMDIARNVFFLQTSFVQSTPWHPANSIVCTFAPSMQSWPLDIPPFQS